MSKVIIYTDGSCSGNPGPGGWAAVIIEGKQERSLSGHEENTTNNRMELLAAINGLDAIDPKISVLLYTDSKYVMQGITEWIKGWKRNNWRTSNNKPVKNIDLWQSLDKITINRDVEWKWVKGHSGNKYNDLVDSLAVEACKKIGYADR